MERKCLNCYYWHEEGSSRTDTEGDRKGECRFNMPVFHPALKYGMPGWEDGYWPKTEEGDWCGKFEGRDRDGGIAR
jgi:hypothetical protein